MFQTNSSFRGYMQTAWDSTSLGLLKECPRKYYYAMIIGIAARTESVHLTFGILYHSALEEYDHIKAAGADHETALRGATLRALKDSWRGKRAWQSDDPNKNRYTLVRSVVDYLDRFADDPLETIILANGKPAVELSFRYESGLFHDDRPILFTGHIDRLVRVNGGVMPLDRKTTKSTLDARFFEQFNPSGQITGYCFAARVMYGQQVRGVIIDGAQILVNSTQFMRGVSNRTDSQLNEWFDTTSHYVQLAAHFAQSAQKKFGLDYLDAASAWPMNEKSCGNYGGCDFRYICSKPPNARKQWVTQAPRRIWDPLVARGDAV